MQQFHPHPYQQAGIDAILEKPGVALWMEMGLGKTVVTLTAIDQLIYDRLEISRVLIVAPKKVAEATWQDEAAKWGAPAAPAHFYRAGHREAAQGSSGSPSGYLHHQPRERPLAGTHAGPELEL